MKFRHFHIALAALALVLAMPVDAQRLPTTNPGPHAAQINGAPGKVTEDIFPVRIVEINGRNIQPRQTIWLEPGRYEFRVLVDIPRGLSFPRSPADSRRWRQADPQTRREALTIELEVEAGKTYQIRARYNSRETEEFAWSTVLWRIEE